MTTRAIQHIPAHLSFGAVTCNRDNWPASVVTECCRLNCPLCHRNRRVPHSPTLSFTSAVSGPADQPALSRCSRHFLFSQLDPLAGFLRSRFLDAWRAFMTPGTLGLAFHGLDRVSRSPSSTCTASPPAAASFRSLCTFRACRSIESVPSKLARLLSRM